MEITSIQKFIHTSPRKLRLVTDMVRKMEPDKALETLRFTQKAAAKELSAAIVTALANAKQKGLEKVNFEKIEINEGPKMRRFRAGTRGRVKPYKRRMAHIKIVLSDELKVESQVTKVKSQDKKQTIKNEKVEEKVKEEEKGEQS